MPSVSKGSEAAAHREFLSVRSGEITADLLQVLQVPPLGIFDFFLMVELTYQGLYTLLGAFVSNPCEDWGFKKPFC